MQKIDSGKIILRVFLILFLISFFMLGWLLWPFLSIIVLAAVVSGIFNPVYSLIKKKIPSPLASLVTCLIIFCILFVPIVLFVSILTNEAYVFYLTAKEAELDAQLKSFLVNSRILDTINQLLSRFNLEITGEELIRPISELGKTVGFYLFNQVGAIAQNVLSFLVNFFLMLLVVYYLFIDGARLGKFITGLSPLPDEQHQKLFVKFKDMAGAIVFGNGLCGIIQGILGGVIFALVGFKSPFMWGVIMALLAFLPIVGIGIVFFPAIAYLFVDDRWAAAVGLMVLYIIITAVIEYLFKPKLVGRRVQMHTLLVFFSIMGGLKLFGILGIIYGPLVVTFFSTLTDIYHSSYKIMVEPE